MGVGQSSGGSSTVEFIFVNLKAHRATTTATSTWFSKGTKAQQGDAEQTVRECFFMSCPRPQRKTNLEDTNMANQTSVFERCSNLFRKIHKKNKLYSTQCRACLFLPPFSPTGLLYITKTPTVCLPLTHIYTHTRTHTRTLTPCSNPAVC